MLFCERAWYFKVKTGISILKLATRRFINDLNIGLFLQTCKYRPVKQLCHWLQVAISSAPVCVALTNAAVISCYTVAAFVPTYASELAATSWATDLRYKARKRGNSLGAFTIKLYRLLFTQKRKNICKI